MDEYCAGCEHDDPKGCQAPGLCIKQMPEEQQPLFIHPCAAYGCDHISSLKVERHGGWTRFCLKAAVQRQAPPRDGEGRCAWRE